MPRGPDNGGKDPEDRLLERNATLPEILSYREIDRFLLAIDDIEDLLTCRIMLFAGLRLSETLALRPRDMDLESRALFVAQGKGGKSRYAPCDIHTLSSLSTHIKARDIPFGADIFDMSDRTVQRHVKSIAEEAEITHKNVTPHTLRHTCATWQLDHGIPIEIVRDNLGHSDIKVTQIYLHLNIRQRSRTYTEATRFGI